MELIFHIEDFKLKCEFMRKLVETKYILGKFSKKMSILVRTVCI